MTPYAELLDTAVAAARTGGEVLTRWFRSGQLEVRQKKGEHDFVTRRIGRARR